MECSVCAGFAPDDGPCCVFCFYTGRYFENVLLSEERSNVLGEIRMLEHVVRAEVWHQGGGMFGFAVELDDHRIMFPGIPAKINGVRGTMAGIPPVGTPWGVVVINDQNEADPVTVPDDLDDVSLVKAIREISELGAALT